MEKFSIEPSSETPEIYFDKENNKFLFAGKSLPEDVKEFYEPILSWLKEYKNQANEETLFEMKMEYFNTASSKMILEMLEVLRDIYLSGKKVIVHWYYNEDDLDMHEDGEDYADMVDIPFKFFPMN